jgi:hypothetical protein
MGNKSLKRTLDDLAEARAIFGVCFAGCSFAGVSSGSRNSRLRSEDDRQIVSLTSEESWK